MTEERIIADILAREGGFVHHPDDKGGATNHGVTQAALAEWRMHPVTVEDVRALTEAEAGRIYRDRYIRKPGFHHIEDDNLRALAIDCAVHHGPAGAVRLLQRALGFLVGQQDGIFGPVTHAAVEAADAKRLYLRLCAERARKFGRIITDDRRQAAFAAGWMNRLASFIEEAAV